MAAFRQEPRSSLQEFSDVVAGLGLEDFSPADEDLLRVWRDYGQVGLNGLGAEALRRELLECYAMTMIDIHALGLNANGDEFEVSHLITKSLNQLILRQRQEQDVGRVLGVRGDGLFSIPGPNPERLVPEPLLGSETLFGTFTGIVYGEYWLSPEGAIDVWHETGKTPPVVEHAGALICLEAVEVCSSAEEFGRVDRTYDEAFLTIHDSRHPLYTVHD